MNRPYRPRMDHYGPPGCPRCGSSRVGGNSARSVCNRCGADWQSGQDAEPADDLGSTSLTTGALRAWYAKPEEEADRAAARRFLDSLADRNALEALW